MRSSLLVVLLATSSHATFFGLGCGSCGGGFGGGYGGYSSYAGGYTSYGASSYPSSYGLPNMNAPGAYFQPVSQGASYQTLYAGQPYFTPADGSYGGMGGQSYPSYGGAYPQSSPVYTQILPLPANAQIVSNIPAIPQASPSYSQPSYTPQVASAPQMASYAVPSTYQAPPPPQPVPIPPTPPQSPPQTGYVQPAAPVQPYAAVPHASIEGNQEVQVAPTAMPVSVGAESSDYGSETENETVTEQPVVVTTVQTYTQPAAPVMKKEQVEPAVHMINSPEEAGYRRRLVKVLKKKL